MEPLNRDLQVSFILLSPPVTPARVDRLDFLLQGYRSHLATYLVNGFRYGFRIQFISDGTRGEFPNLKSALQNPDLVKSKLQNEISAGGIAGPYTPPPPAFTHFFDDFLFLTSSLEKCHTHLPNFLRLCNYLGVPIAHETTVEPRTTIEFGITIDSISQEARLPPDKLKKCRTPFISFAAGDFALVAVVQAWAAAAVGAFVSPLSCTLHGLGGAATSLWPWRFLSPHLC